MGLRLEPLMSYRVELQPPLEVGTGPLGDRRIFHVVEGRFEGPRLRGRILPGGADWLLVGPDGVGRLDVRATFETDDGALIYLQYHGIVALDERVMKALAEGRSVDYGETYFVTQPRFETGAECYAWLNRIVCVAEGRLGPGWVEYRVFELRND